MAIPACGCLVDKSQKNSRSRNASDRTDDSAAHHAGAGAVTSSSAGLETCFNSIAEAQRQLSAPPETSSFLVKPAILDPCESVAGSIGSWSQTLALHNDAVAQLGLRIELPKPGEIRARQLISRSRRVMTGKYPSWKIGRLVHWESRLESKVFRLLDACPSVERFTEQPFTIHYLADGQWHAHVPDAAFLTHEGTVWILEIKSNLDPSNSQALERAALIAPRLKCIGMNYAVSMEREICAGASLENAAALMRFGRVAGSAIADRSILQMLSERGGLSRADLVGHVFDGKHAFHAAANLALRGEVSLNWYEASWKLLSFQTLQDNNPEESLSWLVRALGVTK